MIRLTQQAITAGGLTTLMVTHSMAEAARVGDRILSCTAGRIAFDLRDVRRRRLAEERPASALRPASLVRPARRLCGRHAAPGVRCLMDDAPLAAALRERYAVEREIARGGMATVYLGPRHRPGPGWRSRSCIRAWWTARHRAIPARDRACPRDGRIRTSSRCSNPARSPAPLYYVMPYVAGDTLAQRLERERRLPLDEAIRLTRDIASALGYAHGAGTLHRDVKPENILLDGAGHSWPTSGWPAPSARRITSGSPRPASSSARRTT